MFFELQVYKGLDVITNKVTAAEMKEVKHHMINIVSPPSEFNVVQFRNRALDIINELSTRKVVPIVVGGTNYYVESLLWNFLIDDVSTADETSDLGKHIQLSHRSSLEIGLLVFTFSFYCNSESF